MSLHTKVVAGCGVCLKVECVLNVKQFSWCSGYHICLTHRRSPVRSRAKTCFPRGLTARISGFHPGGPGSTPGVGIFFSALLCNMISSIENLI